MSRGYGPHYSTASSPGLVTGENPATWAGRGVIIPLWDLALVVPVPLLRWVLGHWPHKAEELVRHRARRPRLQGEIMHD